MRPPSPVSVLTVAARSPSAQVEPDHDPRRWRILALLAIAEVLGMSLWFAGSAVAPQLAAQWGLAPTQLGWLTSAVQLGFVLGTAVIALFNLGDLVPARWLFAVSAMIGAAANALVPSAESAAWGLALRGMTGVALAGVYPPAMKMASTWFRAQRGLAVGTVVGALTVGSASPWLVRALFPGAAVGPVMASASVAALVASVLVAAWYEDGPYPFTPRPFSWGLVGSVVRSREWRLATGGYLGHMFELYSAWTWLAAWMTASLASRGDAAWSGAAPLFAFITIASGSVGCVWGGVLADRRSRAWLVTRALAVSGACSLLLGLLFGASWWLVVPVAIVWGAALVGDSPQFSVLVTESVPSHAVGTALYVQVSLGFLLTLVSIQLVPPLAALIGWQWVFSGLAIGPALGIWSIRRLTTRATPVTAGG